MIARSYLRLGVFLYASLVAGVVIDPLAAAEPTVKVPSLVGLAGKQAKSVAQAAGLVVQFQLGAPAPSSDKAFSIYEQEPPAASAVAPGRTIRLKIYATSAAAASAQSVGADGESVPVVIGRPVTEAKAMILAAGYLPKLMLGIAAPSKTQEFAVYEQRPAPGGIARRGSQVAILIYGAANAGSTPSLARVWSVPFLLEGSEEIDPRSGKVQLSVTDMVVPAGSIKLRVLRTISAGYQGALGTGWRLNWERRLTRTPRSATIETFTGPIRLSFDPVAKLYRASWGDRLSVEGKLAVWTSCDGAREEFDEQGKLLRRLESSGEQTTLDYDVHGRLARVTGPFGSFLNFSYDDHGKLLGIDSSSGCAVRYVYGDGLAAPPDATKREMLSVGYGYDDRGHLARIESPTSGMTEIAYDLQGRVTGRTWSDGASEKYERDEANRTIRHTDAAGSVSTTTWTDNGRRAEIVSPLGTKASLEFDNAGHLVAATGATGQTVRMTHDALGRLVSVEDPAKGKTQFEYLDDTSLTTLVVGPGQRRQTIEYDKGHNVVRTSDSLDPVQTTTLTYTPSGQLQSTTSGTGEKQVFAYDAQGRRQTMTDGAGNIWRYEYDARGNVIKETDPLGGVTKREYDAHNRLLSETDPTGAVTQCGYEQRGRLYAVTVKDGLGSQTKSVYDQRGHLVESKDAAGGITRYTYDPAGRILGQTDPSGASTRYKYDATGQLTGLTNPLGGEEERTYDSLGRLTSERLAAATATKFEYSPQGRLTRQIDGQGRSTSYDYDAADRLIGESDAAKRMTQYEYTPAGRLTKTIPHEGPILTYEYDDRGNLVNVRRGAQLVVAYAYDVLNRCIRETKATGLVIDYHYDAIGNLVGWNDNLGGKETIRYDAAGRRVGTTDAAGAVTATHYDALGNLTKLTDSQGRDKTLEYDSAGRLTMVHEPNGDRAGFNYDATGRVKSVQHPSGGQSTAAFDHMGNVVSAVDPSGGESQSTFDAAGRVLTSTDAKGQTTTYSYDNFGRLTEKQLADKRTVRYTYDDQDRLLKVDNGKFPVVYTYDNDGNVSGIEYPVIKRKLVYEYNDVGLQTRFTDSEGSAVNYVYDTSNRLASIEPDDKAKISLTYDAKDRIATVVWPNKVKGTWTYDNMSRPLKLAYTDANGNSVVGWTYKYDAAGNCSEAAETAGRTVRYRYDPSGQLLAEDTGDGKPIEYGYLPGGNRGSRVQQNDKVVYRYDEADRLLAAGPQSFIYDKNGNLIERKDSVGATRYTYDVENRLVRVQLPDGKQVDYGYSPTGERIWRKDSAGLTYFVTDGSNVLAELDESLKSKATYLHGPNLDQPLMMKRKGESYCFHADRLGSVARLTDRQAKPVATYEYDAYGKIRSKQGTVESPFTYTARELDPLVGEYYFRARYYSPTLGRFLSKDPVAPRIEEPRTLNPYLYADNAPTRWTDPRGEAPGVNLLQSNFYGPQPLPPGLAPSTPIYHYTALDVAQGATDAAQAGRGISFGPGGGTMHVTTLPPGSGARFPTGIGTPQNTSASFSTTAGELAAQGMIIKPNPNRNFRQGTNWLIVRGPGQRDIRLPPNTRVTGPFFPRSRGFVGTGNRGGYIGSGGSALSVPRGVRIPRGGPTPWGAIAKTGVLLVDVGVTATDIANAEDKPHAVLDAAVSHATGAIGATIGGGLMGPLGAVGGGTIGGMVGSALVNPAEPGPPVYLPPESDTDPTNSAPATSTTAGTPVLVPDVPNLPSPEVIPLSDIPKGNSQNEPDTFLGPAPEPDPNRKWPVCPKCGKRHDPNEK